MLPHHKNTEEHGTFSHIHKLWLSQSHACWVPTQLTTIHGAWKQNALKIKRSILVGVWFIFWCWAIGSGSTTLNLAHNTQQIIVFQSGLLAMAFSSLAMSVAVGLRWASGSPSMNLFELFVHFPESNSSPTPNTFNPFPKLYLRLAFACSA